MRARNQRPCCKSRALWVKLFEGLVNKTRTFCSKMQFFVTKIWIPCYEQKNWQIYATIRVRILSHSDSVQLWRLTSFVWTLLLINLFHEYTLVLDHYCVSFWSTLKGWPNILLCGSYTLLTYLVLINLFLFIFLIDAVDAFPWIQFG